MKTKSYLSPEFYNRDYSVYHVKVLKKRYRPLFKDLYNDALNHNKYDLAEYFQDLYFKVDDIIYERSFMKKLIDYTDDLAWDIIKPFYAVWYFMVSLFDR